jgi:hypothetical protein
MSPQLGSELAWVSDSTEVRGAPANAERVLLHDGSDVVIRSLTAGDEPAIADWFTTQFADLGAETLYARLLVLLERLDHSNRSPSATTDPIAQETIAAFAPDGVTVGLARLTPTTKPTNAEITVAVTGERHELQRLLLERAASRAHSTGIEQLTSICLANDDTLINLLSRLGPTTIGATQPGLIEARIDLTGR